jgi:hypothetical protein
MTTIDNIMALADALLFSPNNLRKKKRQALRTAIEQALTPGEPVALGPEWTPCMKLPVVVHVRQQRPGEAHVSTREGITPVKPDDLIMRGVSGEEYPIGQAIFEQTYTLHVDTAPPPQRDWVGLTDTERAAVQFKAFKRGLTPIEFMELHEDKLKEKNYGLR